MQVPDLSERRALARLCSDAAELTRIARTDGWQDEWEQVLAAVRQGGSAVDAWHRLGLVGDEAAAFRGVDIPGLDPVVLDGRYVCPRDLCPRRADRDERGRPPRCVVHRLDMRFAGDDG